MKEPTYIDLFAGAGGLSEGFIRAGFKPLAHVEMDKYAVETLKTRLAFHYLSNIGKENKYYDYLKSDISREDLFEEVPKSVSDSVIQKEITSKTIHSIFRKIDKIISGKQLDIIVGGPPCQAYSLVGRSRDPNRMTGDKRNYLFKYYARFLKRYKPKYFVFENVTGLLTARDYLKQMVQLFESEKIGYKVAYSVLNAADFGVIQNRKRVILIGSRLNKDFQFPDIEKVINTWTTKNHLFSDLPKLEPGEYQNIAEYTSTTNEYLEKYQIRNGFKYVTQHIARSHNERDLEIYRIVLKNWIKEKKRIRYDELPEYLKTHNNQKSFLDRFKVVDPFGPSHTLVAHVAKDGHYYIFPDLDQTRSISVREAARIQSFPDNYFFEGGRTQAFRQIGNAVPPLMAEAIAESLKELLLNS